MKGVFCVSVIITSIKNYLYWTQNIHDFKLNSFSNYIQRSPDLLFSHFPH